MLKLQILSFIARWLLSCLGMWLSITFFGTITGDHKILTFLLAGLIFSLANSLIRPLATTMTLPLIIFTMGLFTLVINATIVALAIWLTPAVTMDFTGVLFSSLIMSGINSLVNFWISPYTRR